MRDTQGGELRGAGSVLLVTPSLTRDGGVATHVRASAAALAARGTAVSVLVARVGEDAEVADVTVHHVPALGDRQAPVDRRLGDALRSAPEVIHVHHVDDPALVAGLRAIAPVVMSVHAYTACTSGHHYFRAGEECSRPHGPGCVLQLPRCAHTRHPKTLPRRYLSATRTRDALALCDLAVSYSSAIDRHLDANGIRSRAVVPLFPTMPAAAPPPAPPRRRVLFAGRLLAAKGAAILIRAAREVDAEFLICGAGRDAQALQRLATHTGVAERVRFLGWLGADELAREIAGVTVVAVPSLWPEPFGLVGIEALAAGRPVVASATGGILDWLQDGVNGLAVRPGDPRALAAALRELLDDPQRADLLGAQGRDLVASRYTPARHVQALERAYAGAATAWRSRGRRP